MVLNRCQMRLLDLSPDTGRRMAAADAGCLHRYAGAANHGVELVTSHEFGQSSPLRQNHAA